MENDLASQLIAANEERRSSKIQIDELGIPLPLPQTNRAHYNYLTARAFKRNPHLHTRHNGTEVWNSHTLIQPTLEDIARLTDWVDKLPTQAIIYIYDKIKELAPPLDEDIIAITPHLAWSFKEQKLIEFKEEINVISDW